MNRKFVITEEKLLKLMQVTDQRARDFPEIPMPEDEFPPGFLDVLIQLGVLKELSSEE